MLRLLATCCRQIGCLVLAVGLLASPGLAATELRIAAAANLRPLLQPLLQPHLAEQPGLSVSISFAASGKLSTQIRHGAPFDLFLSADEVLPQALHDDGLALGPVQRYTRGQLMLWQPATATPVALAELAGRLEGKLAIANPRHAPYGQCAQAVLVGSGQWQALQDRLVYGENVAQAAQLVLSGAAQAALLARSLAADLPAGQIEVVDGERCPPLWQAAIVLRRGVAPAQAQAVLDYLRSAAAQQRWQAAGYLPLAEAR